MFKTPEPLDLDRHVRLKLASTPDYRFAADQIVCPVVSGEMWQVAREYIMVFPIGGNDLPLALMGTQAGVNAYVGDGNPAWWARYVPAHFRRYPFVAASQPAQPGDDGRDSQRFTLCVDTSAPQLHEADGQPLFNEDHSPSELLDRVRQALISLQRDFDITRALVKQIDEAGLLIERSLTVEPVDSEPVSLQGFRLVDQEKLRAASPALLASLISTRALDLIYAHVGSLSNLQDGLLARIASGKVVTTAGSAEVDIGKLLGTSDDTIQFNF